VRSERTRLSSSYSVPVNRIFPDSAKICAYLLGKHFQQRAAEPRISPLRSPGFPVGTRGSDGLHAALFTESRTRARCQQREVGNPGSLRSRRQRVGSLWSGALVNEKRLLFSNFSPWKHRPLLCHLDRSVPGFPTSQHSPGPRVRFPLKEAA
jgi:hypothetical protein